MAEYFNLRRRILIVILFFLIFISFAAQSAGYWIHWTFISICWGFLLLLDFLFMNDDSFIYDPSYRGWAQRSGYE